MHDQVDYVVLPFSIILLVNIIQEIFSITISITKTSFFDFNILTTLKVLEYKLVLFCRDYDYELNRVYWPCLPRQGYGV